jgi:mono/diheme cytochrome c family protein
MCVSWKYSVVFGFALTALVGAGINAQSSAPRNPEAARMKNPVPATPESVAAGQKTFLRYCRGCHGMDAKGGFASEAAPAAPDLTDDMWNRGASDGDIYQVISKGAPPDMFMAPFGGQLSTDDIWNLVNYIRSLGPKK